MNEKEIEKKGYKKEAEIDAEKLEKYMNADKKIVSKHKWLLDQIYEEHSRNSFSGEEVGDKKYVGKTKEYVGLEIYVDGEDKLWAGDIEWVIPIRLFKED